jgi:pheromone a factor receptor
MFAKHLSNSNAALSTTVYLRLLMVVIVQMTSGILVTGASIVLTGKSGLNPWISWENTHLDFWRIRQFPEVIIDIQGKSQLEAFFWVIPVAAVVFSAFFSFNDEVTKEYRGVVTSFRKVILRMPDSKLSTSTYG